ncbi:cytochrome B561 [Vibrio maritimus]|uniref:Cytochrome B561 n=1 Tax=Vibrio maritimus TaxID=990268 RepID=A0A090SZG6_9VIBR|nr:cytochrome B561 [Vibrio maritimus]
MAVKEVKNYNPVARALHWLSAIVVIGMFAVGLWMVDLTYYSQWYKTAPDWHRSVGILLAMATVFRLVWKHITVAPQVEGNQFEKVGAKVGHIAMYVALFCHFCQWLSYLYLRWPRYRRFQLVYRARFG